MTKRKQEWITCDVCGNQIQGDHLVIQLEWGFQEVEIQVHNPRTAPITPCGNQTLRKLLELFPYSEVLKEEVSHYD